MRYQVQCGLIPDWIPHMPTKIEMDAFRIEIGEKRMSEKVVVTFDFKDLKNLYMQIIPAVIKPMARANCSSYF